MGEKSTDKLRRATNIALCLAAAVIVSGAARYAQNLLAPAFLALVVGVVLSPISDMWERIGFPQLAGALTSLLVTLCFLAGLIFAAVPVVDRVSSAWPMIVSESQETISNFRSTFQGIESAGEQMDDALSPRERAQAAEIEAQNEANEAEDDEAGISVPDTTDALFLAPSVLAQAVTFAGVLFFFLLTRKQIYGWIAEHVVRDGAREETVRRLSLAERQVARYFLTITVVNIGFGLCVTVALYFVGVPSSYLWGIATFLVNFILYLGPAILFAALLVTGVVLFDGLYSFVPALVFISINLVEAQFITPSAIGKSLSVNPLLVFVAMVFFLWLWGPMGGFIAIPLLLWVLVLSDTVRTSRSESRVQ